MACFYPLVAFQRASGEVVVVGRKSDVRVTPQRLAGSRELTLPCGQCVGCRLERSRQWAIRCVHEASMHDANSFVTLTYDDEHYTESLDYSDFQLFMRRLRKKFGKVRFFMCGEYGEQFLRPHFHACLFGVHFPDREVIGKSEDYTLYRSPTLEKLWPMGLSSIGDVTFDSAAYIARYCVKKVTGIKAESHYERVSAATGEVISVKPEFAHMSLKPGIGAKWFDKYRLEVFGKDGGMDRVVINGREVLPPRYYHKLLEKVDGFSFDAVAYGRVERALAFVDDNSPARLAVKEQVVKAALNSKQRSL